MSVNRVVLTGNLGNDPEVRMTQSGNPIMEFSLAVNDRRRNPQTGEWSDYCNWVTCVMFGKRAESLSNYLRKGSKVGVDGKLHYSSWEKDGQKRSKLEVTVDDLEMLDTRQQDQQQTSQGSIYDDDIPW